MRDPIQDLVKRLKGMAPSGNMLDYIRLSQELVGRLYEQQKGAASGRPSVADVEYKNMRLFVLDRDQYRCRCCYSARDLQVDHIVGRDQGGADHPDNLWTLCARCHRFKEDRVLVPVQDQQDGHWKMIDTRRAFCCTQCGAPFVARA